MKRTIICLIISFVLAFSFPVSAYAKGSVARVVVPSKSATVTKSAKTIQPKPIRTNMIQKYGFVNSCALSSKTPRIKKPNAINPQLFSTSNNSVFPFYVMPVYSFWPNSDGEEENDK